MINIAINGFGRIGRNIVRALYENGYEDKIRVVAINDFVINNVLGVAPYSTDLQTFIDDNCVWDLDPSANAGAPTAWIELMQSAGYDVVDTNPDNA